MNFLCNSYVLLQGNFKFWIMSCCRQMMPQVMNSVHFDNEHNILNAQGRTVAKLQHCKVSSNCPVKKPFFMQIRFKKDYPRLHRDTEIPNFDYYRKNEFKDLSKTKWGSGNEKQGYTYTVGFFGLLCGVYGLKSELTHFVTYMAAAADVLALATIEVDISNIPPGMCFSYKWRGKPLFIKHRTEQEIGVEAATPLSALRDPQTPEERVIKPEWLIVIGICTHLGCVPVPNSGDFTGGFYCPCHGSHYDNVGRTRKGPAPLNLEVPAYKFLSDNVVLVGE